MGFDGGGRNSTDAKKEMERVLAFGEPSTFSYLGTTFIAVINKSGMYFMADGLSYRTIDCDTVEKIQKLCKANANQQTPKIFKMGSGMLVVVCGQSFWYLYILNVLWPKVVLESWTPEQCAREAKRIMETHTFSDEELKLAGFPAGYDMKREQCGIVFGSYIEKTVNNVKSRVPSMYYATPNNVHEILEVSQYHGSWDGLRRDNTHVGYVCGGSGNAYAYSELKLYSFHRTKDGGLDRENLRTLENGYLTKNEHAYVMLKGIQNAINRDIPLTGGYVSGWYITLSGISELQSPVHESNLQKYLDAMDD